jgi:hypothetical protein
MLFLLHSPLPPQLLHSNFFSPPYSSSSTRTCLKTTSWTPRSHPTPPHPPSTTTTVELDYIPPSPSLPPPCSNNPFNRLFSIYLLLCLLPFFPKVFSRLYPHPRCSPSFHPPATPHPLSISRSRRQSASRRSTRAAAAAAFPSRAHLNSKPTCGVQEAAGQGGSKAALQRELQRTAVTTKYLVATRCLLFLEICRGCMGGAMVSSRRLTGRSTRSGIGSESLVTPCCVVFVLFNRRFPRRHRRKMNRMMRSQTPIMRFMYAKTSLRNPPALPNPTRCTGTSSTTPCSHGSCCWSSASASASSLQAWTSLPIGATMSSSAFARAASGSLVICTAPTPPPPHLSTTKITTAVS